MRQRATASNQSSEVIAPAMLNRTAAKPPQRTHQQNHAAAPQTPWSGNQVRLRRLLLQRKIAIGSVHDPMEAEADRAADHVLRTPTNPPAIHPGSPQLTRKCSHCEKEEEEEHKLNTKSANPAAPATGEAPGIVHNVLQTPGQSLDPATRSYFEPRFGKDFGGVRIHTGAHAAESARAVNALAYTVGHHIVFGDGQFSPDVHHGRRLIAHELAHVVQQGATGPSSGPAHAGEPARPEILRRAPPPHPDDHAFQEYHGPQPAGPPLAQPLGWDELFHKVVSDQRAFLFTTPSEASNPAVDPRGVGRGVGPDRSHHGSEVIAAIEILDHDGNRVAIGFGAHRLLPGGHGEEQAMAGLTNELAGRDVHGGKMMVVVDQFPCGPDNHNCGLQLRQFAHDHGLELEVRVPMREHATQSGRNVSPRTASRGAYRTDLDADPRTQVHLEVVDHEPAPPAHGGGGGAPPAHGGGTPPAHDGTEADQPTHPTGPGAAKPATGTDGESEHMAGGGGAGTGGTPRGRFTGVAIGVGSGIASLGLGWLGSYLKAKADQKSANRQIDALKEVARKKINANPDGALKQMMLNPDATVYAWVYLNSAVITTFGVDSASAEPVSSDSSPLLEEGQPIEYMFVPVDPSLIDTYPRISGGGLHYTIVHTIAVDIPIQTPPLEDLIAYAKIRNLPMDDLKKYVMGRYEGATSSLQTILDARQGILNAHQGTLAALQQLQAAFQIARKRKDVELQKSIAEKLTSVANSLPSFTDRLKSVEASIPKSEQNLDHWQHILDLVTRP